MSKLFNVHLVIWTDRCYKCIYDMTLWRMCQIILKVDRKKGKQSLDLTKECVTIIVSCQRVHLHHKAMLEGKNAGGKKKKRQIKKLFLKK